MTALHDPAAKRAPDVVDLGGFRDARGSTDAPAPAPTDRGDATNNVVAFPAAAIRPRRNGSKADFDPQRACEQLVRRFRVMHEAMIELIVSCRDAEPGTVASGETTEVMINLATLSMSTERFQEQLAKTVAAAFR